MPDLMLVDSYGNPMTKLGNPVIIPEGSLPDDCDCCECIQNCCDNDNRWKCGPGDESTYIRKVLDMSYAISGLVDEHLEIEERYDKTYGSYPGCAITSSHVYKETRITGLSALNGTYGGFLRAWPTDATCTISDADYELLPDNDCQLHSDICRWKTPLATVSVSVYEHYIDKFNGAGYDRESTVVGTATIYVYNLASRPVPYIGGLILCIEWMSPGVLLVAPPYARKLILYSTSRIREEGESSPGDASSGYCDAVTTYGPFSLRLGYCNEPTIPDGTNGPSAQEFLAYLGRNNPVNTLTPTSCGDNVHRVQDYISPLNATYTPSYTLSPLL